MALDYDMAVAEGGVRVNEFLVIGWWLMIIAFWFDAANVLEAVFLSPDSDSKAAARDGHLVTIGAALVNACV